MSDITLYKGRGTPDQYDDLMDFLNYVFGFDGDNEDFKTLLPKLYRPACDPAGANYIISENGKLKAAIGAFDSVLQVGKTPLHCRGIGNVAVHPYARSKGYMIDCMNRALADMVKDGVDYSILGGRRQRYNFFGFEKCGPQYHASFNQDNMRYCFSKTPFTELDLHKVGDDEPQWVDAAYALHQTRPEHTVRSREQFLDICRSWHAHLYVILRDGACIGYYVGSLQELTLQNNDDFFDVIRNYLRHHGDVSIPFAAWETDLFAKALTCCESWSMDTCDMFSIFNYQRVIGAFLALKASYTRLADGVLTVLVHGFAGDESLRIEVKDGQTSVTAYDGSCDLTLEHREAALFFFGLHAPQWNALDPAVRSWFPLPLYVDSADHV